jgi:hypothetical protein
LNVGGVLNIAPLGELVAWQQMTKLIPDRESLTVEFKSDRDRLPDRELVAAVMSGQQRGGRGVRRARGQGTRDELHSPVIEAESCGARFGNKRNFWKLQAISWNVWIPPLGKTRVGGTPLANANQGG